MNNVHVALHTDPMQQSHCILYDDGAACQLSWPGHINWTAGGIYSKGLWVS